MIKIKKSLRTKLVFLLFLVLIIPSFSKLIRPGYFPMHDDLQAIRLLQMDKCIKDGQFPCRWVPDMGYGYGYPQFNYYNPLPYYLMEGFHLSGLGYLDSIKLGFIASILVSAAGMFLLGKSLWGTTGGFISGLLYIYAPYRAVDIYVRGAMGEVWAFAFLPFIFYSSREVIKGKRKAIVWLALSLAALFTSHNITSLIFMPVFFCWVVFLYVRRYGSPISNLRKELKNVFLAVFWGFAISAFFLLPAWLERQFVHIETLLQGYFNYLAHFVSLGQLLFSNYWGYGDSQLGPFDEISLSIGLVHWILPLLVLGLLAFLRKKKEFLLALFFTSFGWVALFLTHQKSVWIWDRFPILAFLQFPWRFLILAIFCFSIAAGGIAILFTKKGGCKYIVAIVSILFIFYSTYFQPRAWLDITDEDKFSGELWEEQLTVSIFDYLPIYAEHPPSQEAPKIPTVVRGEGEIIQGEKGTNWQEWDISVSSSEVLIRLPLYDFPGWKVWVDKEEVSINHENELGLITFLVPQGKHEVLAKLTDTPVRKIGNLVSLVSLAMIPLFLRKERKKK